MLFCPNSAFAPLLSVRGDVQLTHGTLVSLEQFGLGGQQSVRGYRQDARLTDNGLLLSAQLRLPIGRIPQWQELLQLSPIDVGWAWNSGDSPDPDPNALVGVGLGLLWRQGDRFSARVDWGMLLFSLDYS